MSSTRTGRRLKNTNFSHRLRLIFVYASLLVFLVLTLYTQYLINKAREEHENIPHIFANYVAYTDGYLRHAEKNAQLITELSSKYLQFTTRDDFQQLLWDYVSIDFMNANPISIIITDETLQPVMWKNVSVPPDIPFPELERDLQILLQDMMENMEKTPLSYNRGVSGYAFYSKPISFEQFIRNVNYSLIVTDREREPLFWRNVTIDEHTHFTQLSRQDQHDLLARQKTMTEVPITNEADSIGYIYFSSPQSLSYIRFTILLEVLLALMVVFFGGYSLFIINRSEKESLWVSLAKETAHQFGTPITSLTGGIEYLANSPPEGRSAENTKMIYDLMLHDLQLLTSIASRFGKVGSGVKLKPHNLHKILLELIEYFRHRLPHHHSTKLEIHLISKIEEIQVMVEPELFKWAMENIIKNCMDSMIGKCGDIIITATSKEPYVYVHIRDEGKGIPRNQWKKIFEPGVTSKERGWGLGLSLAKRIVEEYHHGRIRVLQSTINEGTAFEIRLNTATPKRRKKWILF